MKTLAYLFLLLAISPVKAEIFKCTAANGKVFYQDEQCPKTTREKELVIEDVDPAKIDAAQKKLAEELKEFAAYKHEQARQALREREVIALERNAKANEDIAKASWYQAEIYTTKNRNYDGYFYMPWLNWYYFKDRYKQIPGRPNKKPDTVKPTPAGSPTVPVELYRRNK